MTITQARQENSVLLVLTGRLDSVTQSELTKSLDEIFSGGVVDLVFDLSGLVYISSAGLRVLLSAQKKLKVSGKTMKITGVKPEVKDVFDITGFSGIMNIECA